MKTEPWQQVWFGHEWRRGMNAKETPENDASAAGAEDGVSAATPVTQLAEPSTPNALDLKFHHHPQPQPSELVHPSQLSANL